MPFSPTSDQTLTRRTLLSGTAVATAASAASMMPMAALASSRAAKTNPCIAIHAEAGETLAAIAGDPAIAPELKARVAMTASCPHCGTRLAASRRNV
ncbi:MAG: hypothetical protein KDJ51_10145 [Nitratireductor sp.]|nr:hypothetical protein [Nitratireductor sp.]